MLPANDQASSLRNAAKTRVSALSKKAVCCFAVASGKGGVGKTFMSINLAVAMAMMNRKVLIIDADLGLANADIALGVTPSYCLQDAVFKGKSMDEIVVHTPYGIDLLAASSGAREMVALGHARLKTLIDQLISFAANYDVLIFDCAAGIDNNVTCFLAAAPQTVVVVSPSPASIMDAYALVKVTHQENLCRNISLIVNMAANDQEGERVNNILSAVSENYLTKKLEFLGIVPSSPKATAAIQARKPLLSVYGDDIAAARIREIAKKIIVKRDADIRVSDLSAEKLVNGLMSM